MNMKVILDALIPREDFDIKDEYGVSVGRNKMTISVPDLEYESFTFSAIKKPDFQRETNEWTPDKIVNLITCFLEGELIPSIILWKSVSNYIFVIDGSHRISALAAWINDDYGDGEISRKFFDNEIPTGQLNAAKYTRELINMNIGSYKDLKEAVRKPLKDEKRNNYAKSLGSLAVQVQWVEGNSQKAEDSFFRINQQGTPISLTEIELIKSRENANGLAARAIVRSGKGHNYWSKFTEEKQVEIYKLAKEINDILFQPEYRTPIKTLELPVGGKQLSENVNSMILETINITNKLKDDDIKLADDTGDETIKLLKKTSKVLKRINSMHPSSLGLHPLIYFYSMKGTHKIASYYGILGFIMYLEDKKKYSDFIKIRSKFEEIILYNEYLVQVIVRRYRQSIIGHKFITKYYIALMDILLAGYSSDEAINKLVENKEFNYLSKDVMSKSEITSSRFSDGRKSNIYILNSIDSVPKCSYCGGYLCSKSISIDHIQRIEDGGLGIVENGQLMHPFCNSTMKN